MAAKRGVSIPLLLVFGCAVGAILVLNREPPPQRVAGGLATTPLQTPIGSFSEAWSIAERVLAEKRHEFKLSAFLVAVPSDRDAPPTSMYLDFRSITDDREFYIQIDNADLEMVISATFPIPPQLQSQTTPEPVDARRVTVTLGRALSLADSTLALRGTGTAAIGSLAGESPLDLSTEVVLRTRRGRSEWSVSYLKDIESGPEVVATIVIDASDGSLRLEDGS